MLKNLVQRWDEFIGSMSDYGPPADDDPTSRFQPAAQQAANRRQVEELHRLQQVSLAKAVSEQDEAKVREWLNKKVDPNGPLLAGSQEWREPPLFTAVRQGSSNLAQLLIKAKAQVNFSLIPAKAPCGYTPLYVALRNKFNLEEAQKQKAAKDKESQALAEEQKSPKEAKAKESKGSSLESVESAQGLIKLLLANKANPSMVFEYGITQLKTLTDHTSRAEVRFLRGLLKDQTLKISDQLRQRVLSQLKGYDDFDAKIAEQKSLMAAVSDSKKGIVAKLLVEQKVHPDCPQLLQLEKQATPLMHTIVMSDLEIMRLLLDAKAEVNPSNQVPPLYVALKKQYATGNSKPEILRKTCQIVSILLKNRASIYDVIDWATNLLQDAIAGGLIKEAKEELEFLRTLLKEANDLNNERIVLPQEPRSQLRNTIEEFARQVESAEQREVIKAKRRAQEQLVKAMEEKDYESAQVLLQEQKVNPNCPDLPSSDRTPLSIAAEHQSLDMAVLLLMHGAEATNVLYAELKAPKAGNDGIIKLLLDQVPIDKILEKVSAGLKSLHDPASRKEALFLIQLLEDKRFNIQPEKRATVEDSLKPYREQLVFELKCADQRNLVAAVKQGESKQVEELLKRKINPNCPELLQATPDAFPPLIVAVQESRIDIVSLLLEYKANVNIYHGGLTPLLCAFRTKFANMGIHTGPEKMLKLLKCKTDLEQTAECAIRAVKLGSKSVEEANVLLAYIQEHGVPKQFVREGLIRVFHFAVSAGSIIQQRQILDARFDAGRVDVNIVGRFSPYSPLCVAAAHGQLESVEFLLERGAKDEMVQVGQHQVTALYCALTARATFQHAVVSHLMKVGGDLKLAINLALQNLSLLEFKRFFEAMASLQLNYQPLMAQALETVMASGKIDFVIFLLKEGGSKNLLDANWAKIFQDAHEKLDTLQFLRFFNTLRKLQFEMMPFIYAIREKIGADKFKEFFPIASATRIEDVDPGDPKTFIGKFANFHGFFNERPKSPEVSQTEKKSEAKPPKPAAKAGSTKAGEPKAQEPPGIPRTGAKSETKPPEPAAKGGSTKIGETKAQVLERLERDKKEREKEQELYQKLKDKGIKDPQGYLNKLGIRGIADPEEFVSQFLDQDIKKLESTINDRLSLKRDLQAQGIDYNAFLYSTIPGVTEKGTTKLTPEDQQEMAEQAAKEQLEGHTASFELELIKEAKRRAPEEGGSPARFFAKEEKAGDAKSEEKEMAPPPTFLGRGISLGS